MQPRQTDCFKLAEAGLKPRFALEGAFKNSPLENRSCYTLSSCARHKSNLYTTEARKNGEDPMRLYLLTGRREATLYSPRERAALARTEALTDVAQTGAPDEDWAREHRRKDLP